MKTLYKVLSVILVAVLSIFILLILALIDYRLAIAVFIIAGIIAYVYFEYFYKKSSDSDISNQDTVKEEKWYDKMKWYDKLTLTLFGVVIVISLLILLVSIPLGILFLVISCLLFVLGLYSVKNRIEPPVSTYSQNYYDESDDENDDDEIDDDEIDDDDKQVTVSFKASRIQDLNTGEIDWDAIDKSTLAIANVESILDNPAPDVIFKNKSFLFTGYFDLRDKPRPIVESRGGFLAEGIDDTVDYLVIGKYVAPNSAFTNYGHKVDITLKHNKKGRHHIKIISEEHWARFI